MSDRGYSVGVVKQESLPEKMSHLTSRNWFDIFSVKYLKSKHPVCAIPFWLYWKKTRTGATLEIPTHYLEQCAESQERFIFIPLCLTSPVDRGGHANTLLVDRQGSQTAGQRIGTVERFEPHGARAYELFSDYDYASLDAALQEYFEENYGYEYIAPSSYCPYLGPQSWEHYIDESGYCATWSLWYADMRMTYPDIPRNVLVRGMFDKLHEKLSEGRLVDYLLDYVKQVYAVMVADFPEYRDFFINYDEYKKLPGRNPTKKAFNAFVKHMENLIKDPLYINKPTIIPVSN